MPCFRGQKSVHQRMDSWCPAPTLRWSVSVRKLVQESLERAGGKSVGCQAPFHRVRHCRALRLLDGEFEEPKSASVRDRLDLRVRPQRELRNSVPGPPIALLGVLHGSLDDPTPAV